MGSNPTGRRSLVGEHLSILSHIRSLFARREPRPVNESRGTFVPSPIAPKPPLPRSLLNESRGTFVMPPPQIERPMPTAVIRYLAERDRCEHCAVVALRDYLIDAEHGMGIPPELIDREKLTAAVRICRQPR